MLTHLVCNISDKTGTSFLRVPVSSAPGTNCDDGDGVDGGDFSPVNFFTTSFIHVLHLGRFGFAKTSLQKHHDQDPAKMNGLFRPKNKILPNIGLPFRYHGHS